ncbi:MAG TPA: V-type ATPase 116kDa subunit family protein [Methanoregulaceae archaeon]|nr:V-type ATPase 116kDa subunit family protein [Methanoregulaceae archaeon]HPD75210.1 V-type ATPase 116kDa subunit family protein [Methanoregulaceae archaeon]
MLLKMSRVQIVGPKEQLQRVIDLLYHEGSVHLENAAEAVPREEIPLTGLRPERSAEIAEILSRMKEILATLPGGGSVGESYPEARSALQKMSRDEIITEAKGVIRELEVTTRDLAAKKRELTLNVATLERYAKVLDVIQPVERELPMLEGFEVTILLIQKEYSEVLGIIRKELETITKNRFEMISTSVDPETLAAILVFNKQYSENVHSFIYSVNVNEVRLPQEYMGRPFFEMFEIIEERKESARAEINLIDERLAALSKAWYQKITAFREVLQDIHDEFTAFSQFATSEYTFVIMGWIPTKLIRHMQEMLKGTFSDTVVLNELRTSWKDMEKAPTCYDNPRWVKPFEFIMNLISPPGYREMDPSPVIAIFFPLFFGIMVGDIGYGLVILALALVLKYRMKVTGFLEKVADILMISSIPTIFFGFLFGEFFGDFGEIMGWIHPVHLFGITWNRIEAMIPMLIIAIGLGVIHIVVGLVAGIYNAYVVRSKKHLAEKCGMLLMVSGIILLVGMLAGAIPEAAMYPVVALIVIGLPLILYGTGVFGTIEIMSTVGNILSYARLMAIGMASVILAMVANRLGVAFDILIIGIIVAILLHALNVILAMFSPSIHAVRLHLVECFSKFYGGSGKAYCPFRREPELNPAQP